MPRPLSLPAALKRIRVSSPFGPRKNPNNPNHIGCDWATPVGLPLECTLEEGTVVLVGGSNTHGWGYHVHIQCLCPFKHQVEYHILRDDPRKRWKVGDRVKFGDVIGHTGRSGSLAGKRYDPHHHHGTSELNARGKRVYLDPLVIGWPDLAGLQSKPFEEDDMYSIDDRKRDDNAAAATGITMAAVGRIEVHAVNMRAAINRIEVDAALNKWALTDVTVGLRKMVGGLVAAVSALNPAGAVDSETLKAISDQFAQTSLAAVADDIVLRIEGQRADDAKAFVDELAARIEK